MKRFTRKIMAGAMAVSLVMGSSLVAFAEDPAPAGTGTSGGTGGIEGIVETDVYQAALPTESATAYDYIADPQGLIRKTNAAAYAGKEFGEGTVFFTNGSGDDVSYSNTSDAATIVNKSSKNLSVKVTATATPDSAAEAAALATDKTFADDNTDLEVYLGITDSVEGSTEKALTAAGVEMTAVLGAAPEDAYEYKYDSTDTTAPYKYALKSDISAFTFAEYSFQINGAANANAAWKADTKVPAVSVKWDVDLTDDSATVATPEQTPPEVAPSITTTSYPYTAGTAIEVPVNLGQGALAATGIDSVTFTNADGGQTTLPSTRWTYSEGKITFTGEYCGKIGGGTRVHTIVFNDTAKTQVTLTLTPASE